MKESRKIAADIIPASKEGCWENLRNRCLINC